MILFAAKLSAAIQEYFYVYIDSILLGFPPMRTQWDRAYVVRNLMQFTDNINL